MTEVTQDHKDAQIAANRIDYDVKYSSLTVEVDGKTYQASSESIEQMVRNLSLTHYLMAFSGSIYQTQK